MVSLQSKCAEEDMQETMRQWMDIEEIISYAVVDCSIRNDDGAFIGTAALKKPTLQRMQ